MTDQNTSESPDDYVPDKRLGKFYRKANDLDTHGLEELCPVYSELMSAEPHYENGSLIGQGALKDVYRIFDRHLQRWVAMARLRPERGPDFYDLFVREARLIATLSHPNIIKVYNMGLWDDGRPFFTMDLKSNTTLADGIKRAGQGDLHQLLQIFGKVCDAVAYAHSRGVLHLDLKPDNIQLDDYGEVLVCDWGLGKIVEEAEFEQADAPPPAHIWGNMTLMGQIKGSPGYMAPEQVVAGSAKDHRTDVYALGCVLHCILTGQPPFTGERDLVLEKTASCQVASPRLRFPEKYIPEGLDAVVVKATALDPAQRYQSVAQFHQEIESFLAGFSTLAEQPGFFREARLFVARNRVPVAILAIALLVIGMTSVFFAQRITRQKLATAAERERAARLATQIDTLDSEYSGYVEQAHATKKQLATALAESARELRNLAIFEHPLNTVRRTRQLIKTALSQDPDCIEAHTQHYATDCVELNYKAALARPPAVRAVSPYDKYIFFAQAFPEFDFSERKRPTIPQLTDLFKQAKLLDKRQWGYFERVLSYDLDARKDKQGYEAVMEAFLQYRHGGAEHFSLTLDAGSATLSLRSNQALRVNGQYGNSLLRFLSFRFLELDVHGRFGLWGLDGLPIESLDLSRCRRAELKKPVSLPQLKTLTLHPGQFSEKELRQLIQSNEPFEIIETRPSKGK